MRTLLITSLIFITLSSCAQKQSVEKGWIELFNGKDLKDWNIKIRGHELNNNFANTFRVEDGKMVVRYDEYKTWDNQYGHIFHKKKFSAYLLVVEYRFVGEQIKGGEGWALRNSGAMLHSQDPATMGVSQDFPVSLEMQFLGGNGKDERSTGNLCTPGTNVYLADTLFTPHCINSSSKTYHGDQWVRAEVLVLRDSVIKHIIEGDTVLAYTKPQVDGRDKSLNRALYKDKQLISEGYIALQSESHPVEFRKVELFNLEPYIKDPGKLQEVLAKLQNKEMR